MAAPVVAITGAPAERNHRLAAPRCPVQEKSRSDSLRAKRQEIESQGSSSHDPPWIPVFLTHGIQECSHLAEITELSSGNALRLR